MEVTVWGINSSKGPRLICASLTAGFQPIYPQITKGHVYLLNAQTFSAATEKYARVWDRFQDLQHRDLQLFYLFVFFYSFALMSIVNELFWKYAYLLCCWELDEKIDTTLISVQYICPKYEARRQEMDSLADSRKPLHLAKK